MKNSLSAILFTLFLAGCATIDGSSSVLYQEYSRYERSTDEDNIIAVAHDFFSPSLLGKNYRSDPDAISQLLFKNYMAKTDSHHEKLGNRDGCLSINGYDDEGFPLIFAIKYTSMNDHWLIDKIRVVFVEDKAGFAESAKCPDEYPD